MWSGQARRAEPLLGQAGGRSRASAGSPAQGMGPGDHTEAHRRPVAAGLELRPDSVQETSPWLGSGLGGALRGLLRRARGSGPGLVGTDEGTGTGAVPVARH